jgi:hypothetical protein
MRASSNRLTATIIGIAYVLVGVGGFFVTAGVGFVDTPGGLLLGTFEVNILHNLVHLLLGAALLLAGLSGARAAKAVNAAAGTVCLLLGLAGLFIVGSPFNILAINGADNVLHFGSAVLLLAVGLGAEHGRTSVAAP